MKKLVTTIVFFLCVMSIASAQKVGVNQPVPKQALDVNGKMQIGNDAEPATAGAIRYNDTTNEHEGYNGTEWKSFTEEKSSGLPSNPVSVYGYSVVIPGNILSIYVYRDDTGSGYTKVPTGKFLIINLISIISNNLGSTGRAVVKIGPGDAVNGLPTNARSMVFGGDRLNPQIFTAGASPLLILRGGEYLNAVNENVSDYPVNVFFRGFFVDDLKF